MDSEGAWVGRKMACGSDPPFLHDPIRSNSNSEFPQFLISSIVRACFTVLFLQSTKTSVPRLFSFYTRLCSMCLREVFPDGAGNGFPHGGILGGGGSHGSHGSRFEIGGPSGCREGARIWGCQISEGSACKFDPANNFYFHGVDVISMGLEGAKCWQFLAWDRYIHQR